MARKRKQLPELRGIEITGLAAEGKAFAKVKLKEEDEKPIVVFIPYGAPGDIVDIKIDKKKHNFAEGHIIQFIKPSPERINPKCEYFGVCGGCKWQHLPYEEQLQQKRQQVADCLERIAKVEIPEVNPTLSSDPIWHYRNKMEYTFSNKRWKSWDEIRGLQNSESEKTDALGFHIPGSFDKVLHIKDCHLQSDLGNKIRNFIYDFAIENGLSFYNIKENTGLLRTLMIRILESGEVMVCLSFGENDTSNIKFLLESLKEKFPEITSLSYVVNLKLNDSIADQQVITYSGSSYIEERMGNLRFRISAKSFYQTNSRQAEKLYQTAADFAGLSDSQYIDSAKKPIVYDLYTGTGTIANYIASKASKVIGIEYVEDAIDDAKINSEINGIKNTDFYAGDMKDILTDEFIKNHGKPDVMIVDPPRAGMHENVIKTIINSKPDVIVYISCNPATQARDLALLNEAYKVTKVQPVDMFPHTHHVENVVKLELKN